MSTKMTKTIFKNKPVGMELKYRTEIKILYICMYFPSMPLLPPLTKIEKKNIKRLVFQIDFIMEKMLAKVKILFFSRS